MGVGHEFSSSPMNPIVYKSVSNNYYKYPNSEPDKNASNEIKNKGNVPGLTNGFTVFAQKCVVRLLE